MRESLGVNRAQMKLAWRVQVFTMSPLWNLNGSKEMHETHESRAHAIGTTFSKIVFECSRELVVTLTDPLAGWHDGKDVGISSFVGMNQVYTNITTTSLKANANVAYLVHTVLFVSTFWKSIVDIKLMIAINLLVFPSLLQQRKIHNTRPIMSPNVDLFTGLFILYRWPRRCVRLCKQTEEI